MLLVATDQGITNPLLVHWFLLTRANIIKMDDELVKINQIGDTTFVQADALSEATGC